MLNRVEDSLSRRRFSMMLLALFASLALGLVAIGTYGVIAYLVTQGTREIGIRMALGATPQSVLRLIVGHGALMGVVGIGAGLAGALLVTPFMRPLLFGVGPTDPPTLAVIAGLLTLVALAASYFPARRAARTDPMLALRAE
jgi:ABC-type antimicrobial peptide transport system permease subunit